MNTKEIMALTAQKIKETRIEKGFSIQELSRVSKVSIYKIKRIETGNYNFQLKEFNKILIVLNLKLVLKKRPLK